MNNKQKALFYVIAFSLAWSLEIILSKAAFLRGANPLSFLIQFVFIALIILIICNLIFIKKSINKKNILKVAVAGVLTSGLGALTSYYGLRLSTSINYGFIIKTAMVFAIIFGYIFLKEKITSQKIAFSIIMLIGVYLISTSGKILIPQKGDLLILFAAIVYPAGNTIIKKILYEEKAEALALCRAFFGLSFLLVSSLILGIPFYIINEPLLVVITGIISSLVLIFIYKSLEYSTMSYLGMMSMITPLIVIILASIFLGETLNLYQIIGGTLIVISGILISKTDMYKA